MSLSKNDIGIFPKSTIVLTLRHYICYITN